MAADKEAPVGIYVGGWRRGARGRGRRRRVANTRGGWVRGSVSVDLSSISLQLYIDKDALSSYMIGTD